MAVVEQITDPVAHHGEGPVWHSDWPGLRWVDMLAGDVLTLESATGAVIRRHVGSVAAVVRPRTRGGAVLALERGFALADDELGDVRPMEPLWTDGSVRMNEGGCAPDGHFFCGSMAYDGTAGAGRLYRLDPEGRVRSVLDEVTISNGLAWSPDGATAYYVDTPTQRIDAFDYAGGALTGRRTLVRIDPQAGAPDGLTIDADGGIWVALWGGGAVHHYTSSGELVEVIELPTPRVTACTFGGAGLDDLYITTSRVDTDLESHPLAGAVFRLAGAANGIPVSTFDG
jgi:sugar lactone lactonase YvrE